MSYVAIAVGVLVLILLLLELKTSRPDGTLLEPHPFRRLMLYIMPTRSESVVFYQETIRAEKLEAYLAKIKPAFGGNVTHCIVAAANMGLASTPRLNRFVSGRRLYQREGRWLTFSMKRSRSDGTAKLAVVKLQMDDGETFAQFCGRVNEKINLNRSGKKTYADKEFNLFNALPRLVLMAAVPLIRALDHYNLLPKAFIDGDGMYTSAVIANLGSMRMDAGFHHLYEWGNCPIFVMIGAAHDAPVVEDGQVVAGRLMNIRFSYDERIEDGLAARLGFDVMLDVLEDPERYLGCLDEDTGQHPPMMAKVEEALANSDRSMAGRKKKNRIA